MQSNFLNFYKKLFIKFHLSTPITSVIKDVFKQNDMYNTGSIHHAIENFFIRLVR